MIAPHTTNVFRFASVNLVLLYALSAPAVGQTYTVIDLGTFGGAESFAWGINDSGQVAGTARLPNDDNRAFLWTPGAIDGEPFNPQMKDLGTLGGPTSAGRGINDRFPLQVIGTSRFGESPFPRVPFLWTSGADDGVPTNPQMKFLGTIGEGPIHSPFSVNNAGQVVGRSSLGGSKFAAFLWEMDTMYDLGTPGGGPSSDVRDINENGQIVGWNGSSWPDFDAFLWSWDSGSMSSTTTYLGNLGGVSSQAVSINELGQVVGSAGIPGPDNHRHAFLLTPEDLDGDTVPDLWFKDVDADGKNDLMEDLGTLSGHMESGARAINDAGLVVGISAVQLSSPSIEPLPYLYDGTTMMDLNTLILQPSPWVLETPTAINNTGQIVGHGLFNGVRHGFLLIPDDDDGDGIPDVIEDVVDGQGIVVDGGDVTCAAVLPDGTIVICVTDSTTGQEFTFALPPGTQTTLPGDAIELEITADDVEPKAQINKAELPAGLTKAVTLPWPDPGAANRVIINDVPEATIADLTSTDGDNVIEIPPCPCPANQSHNVEGVLTSWTVTNNGDGTVTVSGLENTALGVTALGDPIPTVSEWGLVVMTLLLLTACKIYFGGRRAAD